MILHFLKKWPLLILLVISACATHLPQIHHVENKKDISLSKYSKNFHLYLIGDAGNLIENPTLKNLQQDLNQENENSIVLFLGDNVYPKGIPHKKGKEKETAEAKLKTQLKAVENFKGKTYFIPGNHDWYHGLKGLKEQEKIVKKTLGKDSFIPKNGCPLDKIKVNNFIDIIVIDSQWYLTDWNKHPTINDNCDEIKTRKKFFVELEGLINKSQDKVLLIAIHHPINSVGTHGGEASFKSHILPFKSKIPMPFLGSFFQIVRKTSGLNPQDLQAKRYRELSNRVSTLAKEAPNAIFVSGHDHNLQYIFKNNIPQIVSGSGSKKSPTRLGKNKGFSLGDNGYAILDIAPNRKTNVLFKSHQKTVFATHVLQGTKEHIQPHFNAQFADSIQSRIYDPKDTQKGKLYTKLWGEHYRKYYSTTVKAQTVRLDTLFGGLTIVKKGGGHQSKSIRLVNPEGKQYVIRALKKSAIRFLQTVAFQQDYIADKVGDTYTEELLYDFYTSSHPYAPFVIPKLSSPLGVYHTNPKLYYIPKQKTLGQFNDEFGDALYMIEERPTDGHGDLKSFGFSHEIVSTDDLFKKLRKSKDHVLDEQNYVRARLFDMIIGDWDRHLDQWRWAVFKEGDKTIYRPVPRDRDQAFSNYDGAILETITTLVDPVKLMQTYKPDIRNLYKFNDEPYPIDVSIIQESNYNIWIEQAQQIQQNLTDEVIDLAFKDMPIEVQDKTVDKIKSILKYRRDHVTDIAKEYREILEKFAIVKGTDKDDWFEISTTAKTTKIDFFNIKKGKKGKLHFSKTFEHKRTKEIWIYGLDDDDHFKIISSHTKSPKIRLIGGQNKDTYELGRSKHVYVHDFKSKKNDIKGKANIRLTDQYDKNTYEFRKVKKKVIYTIPLIAFNPDDGFALGGSFSYTNKGFNNQPFMSRHHFNAKYFTATDGFDLQYSNEFATYAKNWNAGLSARFTSGNFSQNFFGFGNETQNTDDDNGFNFNRIKTSIHNIQANLIWRNQLNSKFKVEIPIESYRISNTAGRFITDSPLVEFDRQFFTGLRTHFSFKNVDKPYLATLGMLFNFYSGLQYNITNPNILPYLKSDLQFIHPLTTNKKLVLSSKVATHINFDDEFEIYQAAVIGGKQGLRGFRNERFAGKQSLAHTTDLRYTLGHTKTPLLPLTYGVSLGYDYGRIWIPNDTSDKWHQAYGANIWGSFTGLTKMNLGLYNSTEGLRFMFGFGVEL